MTSGVILLDIRSKNKVIYLIGEGEWLLDNICDKEKIKDFDFDHDFDDDLKTVVLVANLYDLTLMGWSSASMCTNLCPCSSIMDLDKWDENLLNQHMRTKKPSFDYNDDHYDTMVINKTAGYVNFYSCLVN